MPGDRNPSPQELVRTLMNREIRLPTTTQPDAEILRVRVEDALPTLIDRLPEALFDREGCTWWHNLRRTLNELANGRPTGDYALQRGTRHLRRLIRSVREVEATFKEGINPAVAEADARDERQRRGEVPALASANDLDAVQQRTLGYFRFHEGTRCVLEAVLETLEQLDRGRSQER